jgi:Acyclic terpene utilisation family protein AtuA
MKKELTMETIRIGSGAGFSGDRIEPAVELAEKGNINCLVFECLAERTIALAHQCRLKDPNAGYDPLLVDRMYAVLRVCHEKGITIITNMGAANPLAAAAKVKQVAQSLGISDLKIAVITGDDVLEQLSHGNYTIEETGQPVSTLGNKLVSANAYLGAAPIVEALRNGAEVIITGRVADSALFLAPQIHAFGWSMDDWELLGKGTVVGHLLECAGQITGGYFADPGVKDIADLARLGFPIAEVHADGSAVITKVSGSGGKVTTATCKEQLLYEICDPARYLTPDVVADFSSVTFTEIGPNRLLVEGGNGHPKPDSLKVSVGYLDGYIGGGEISYAGPGAVARGRLAIDIVRERLKVAGIQTSQPRFDLIGIDSSHGRELSAHNSDPYEVRVRVAGRVESLREAERLANEVEALYTNGPAGGGGVTKSTRQVVAIVSALLPSRLAVPKIHYLELRSAPAEPQLVVGGLA